MKTAVVRRLRQKLSAGDSVYGLWVTLESASVTEMAVGLGLDWVVVDAEHGHLDWKEVLEHVRATVRSETVALVRVAELERGLFKRVLDIGADGVVVPWVQTEEQHANLGERFEQGFRMLGLGMDSGLLLRSLHEALKTVGRDRKIPANFQVSEAPGAAPKSGSGREGESR